MSLVQHYKINDHYIYVVIIYLVSSGKWLLSGSIDTQLIVAGTHIHECYSVYKHLISAAAGGSESNSTFPALSVSSHV